MSYTYEHTADGFRVHDDRGAFVCHVQARQPAWDHKELLYKAATFEPLPADQWQFRWTSCLTPRGVINEVMACLPASVKPVVPHCNAGDPERGIPPSVGKPALDRLAAGEDIHVYSPKLNGIDFSNA